MQVKIIDPRNEAHSFTATMLGWNFYKKGEQLRTANGLIIEVVDEHSGVIRRHDDDAYFGNLHAKRLGLGITGNNEFWREVNKRLKETIKEEYMEFKLQGTFAPPTEYTKWYEMFTQSTSYKIIPFEKEPSIVPRFFVPYKAVPPLDFTKLKDKRSKFDFDSVPQFADERVGIRVVQNDRITYESPKHRPLTHNGLGQRKFNYYEPGKFMVQVKPRQVGYGYDYNTYLKEMHYSYKQAILVYGFTQQYNPITNEKERFIEDLAWFTINRFSDKG